MAKNLKALGEVYDWPATQTTASGDLVVMEDTVGVALTDAAVGDTIAVRVEGVFELPKAAGAIAQGQAVYWDGTGITATAPAEGAGTYAGKAYIAAAADDTVAQVALNA